MSRIHLTFLLFVALSACGSGGSADGGPGGGGLAVQGTITALSAGATSRLDFPTRTALVDDRGMLASGDLGGRCVIVHVTDGGSDRLDVAVEQTGTMLDSGIHQIEVRLDDTRPGALGGVVTASLGPPDPTGGGTYVTSPGGCVTSATFDAAAHTASVTLASCALFGSSGMMTADGTLSFTGCSVE